MQHFKLNKSLLMYVLAIVAVEAAYDHKQHHIVEWQHNYNNHHNNNDNIAKFWPEQGKSGKNGLQTVRQNNVELTEINHMNLYKLLTALLLQLKAAEQLQSSRKASNAKVQNDEESLKAKMKTTSQYEAPQQRSGLMIQGKPSLNVVDLEPKPFNIIEQLRLEQIGQGIVQLPASGTLRKPSKKKKKRKRKRKRKNKTKKKKKKKKKKTKPVGEAAHVIFTKVTTPKPHYYYKPTTTKKPRVKKIIYKIPKKSQLKIKKKEYLKSLKYVIYPFVKFIAFFTVLNPFTLGVFLFSLISPVVFGFLGFVALSVLVKPALHLLFDVKRDVDKVNRRKALERRRHERLRDKRRPITIHKHYYHSSAAPAAPPHKQHHHQRTSKWQRQLRTFNPVLPQDETKLSLDAAFDSDFTRFGHINYVI